MEVPFVKFSGVISCYENDQFFGHVVRALDGNWSEDGKEGLKLGTLIPLFDIEKELTLYNGKLCAPRKCVSTVLDIVPEIVGNIKFSKTVSELNNYNWRRKAQYIKTYVDGCM